MPTPAELRLRVRHERFEPLDERWVGQVLALTKDLSARAAGLSVRPAPVAAGSKGAGLTEVVLALTSASALTVFKETLRLWLRRDKAREVEISVTDGGHERRLRIRGDKLDNDALDRLLDGVAKQLAS
jgi:hypothetical protein